MNLAHDSQLEKGNCPEKEVWNGQLTAAGLFPIIQWILELYWDGNPFLFRRIGAEHGKLA